MNIPDRGWMGIRKVTTDWVVLSSACRDLTAASAGGACVECGCAPTDPSDRDTQVLGSTRPAGCVGSEWVRWAYAWRWRARCAEGRLGGVAWRSRWLERRSSCGWGRRGAVGSWDGVWRPMLAGDQQCGDVGRRVAGRRRSVSAERWQGWLALLEDAQSLTQRYQWNQHHGGL